MHAQLDETDIEAIARRVLELLPNPSPWLNAEQAAAYIAAPLSRIRKVTMTGELRSYADGRRRLYRRDDLDAFIRSGGASTH